MDADAGTCCTNASDLPVYNEPLSVGAKVPIGIALTIIVLMTISGNILVLMGVLVNRSLRTTTNCFVVSLAFADLLLGVLVLPFSAILQLEGKWMLGTMFCDIWASTDVLCCTASILSLCAISIDRYIGVTRPLQHRTIVTGRKTVIIIVSIWVSSFAISLGPLIGWRDKQRDLHSCTVTTQPGYVIFSTLGSFYIPASILIAIYFRVYKEAILQVEFLKKGFKQAKTKGVNNGNDVSSRTTLRAVTKRSLHSQASQTSLPLKQSISGKATKYSRTSHSTNEVSRTNDSFNNINSTGSNKLKRLELQRSVGSRISKFNKEKKAAKTLGIVVGVFLICWFPFFIVLPLDSLCSSCMIPQPLFDVVFWLGYCNSLLNPIIYATWNREFRKTFVRILKCRTKERKQCVVSYLAHMSAQQMAQTAADHRLVTVQTPSMPPLRKLAQWDTGTKVKCTAESTVLLDKNIADDLPSTHL